MAGFQAKRFEYSDAVVAGERIEAIDFDPLTNVIYWTDTSLKTIQRALLPEQPTQSGYPQDLRIDASVPHGIAFDYVTKVLYWTDKQRGEISCAVADGRYRKTLVTERHSQPSGIAVQPQLGLMFWTDTNPQGPKIESAWMDGSHRKTLVSERLANPTGLALDTRMNNRLYWCDAKENLIESVNSDGSDRVIVASGRLLHPYNLDVFEGHMYWVSTQHGKVMKMDKFGRGVNQTVQAGLLLPKAVKTFNRLRYDVNVKNRCESLDCHPLCVHVPDGAKCLCPDGAEFLPGSNKSCDMTIEKPKPQLTSCPCRNGYCLVSSSSASGVTCVCDEGFSGDRCQHADGFHVTSSNVLAIVLPICVVILLFIVVVVLVVLWRRRGYLG